jgi:hypothetical protein
MKVTMMTNPVTWCKVYIEPPFEPLDGKDLDAFGEAFTRWCHEQWATPDFESPSVQSNREWTMARNPPSVDPADFYQRSAE